MKQRVFLLGATGTIGRATAAALLARGHEVVCFVRAPAGDSRNGDSSGGDTSENIDSGGNTGTAPSAEQDVTTALQMAGATLRTGEVRDRRSLDTDGFRGERFDAMISCLASRTGLPADAWAIDHAAHVGALGAARAAGVRQVVLLSAICVQKPLLAFQQAKLAFERELASSGLCYTIVRPTAYFKSLCGQVARVRSGRPFLVFGDGRLTACKPIADEDLADYLVDCLDDPQRWNRILPIGGPGDAITPRQQGERLFELLGQAPRFRQVPVGLLGGIGAILGAAALLRPSLAAKAELARIGHYYATESMLVRDPVSGRYDAAATPSTGRRTLFDFYARLIDGTAALPSRREHAVF